MQIYMNSFFSSIPITFLSFFYVWSVNKKDKFYKRQIHFASLSFIVVISFPHSIQIQLLKWSNWVGWNCQGLQLLKLKIILLLTKTQLRTGHLSHGYIYIYVCLHPTSKMCTFVILHNQAQMAAIVILSFHTSKQN